MTSAVPLVYGTTMVTPNVAAPGFDVKKPLVGPWAGGNAAWWMGQWGPRGRKGTASLIFQADVVALDCEMVEVAGLRAGSSALCRVSVVRLSDLKILVDTWVEVEGKVTDFRTSITGVDASAYERKRKVSFKDARAAVQAAITGKIVVGHAVWNDFAALRLVHPPDMVRDTALYKGLRPPWRSALLPSLRLLAHHWLREELHATGQEHDSVADASTALKLYKMHQATWEPIFGNQVAEGDRSAYWPGPPPISVIDPYWWPAGF